jgi:hypothetical protein
MKKQSDIWVENHYFIDERKSGLTVLKNCHPEIWRDIKFALRGFRFFYSEIASGGGGKTPIVFRLENLFKKKGWKAVEIRHSNYFEIGKGFDKKSPTIYEASRTMSQTHELDLYKNRIGLEIEWNNKHQFFSRDIELFSYLYEVGVIDVGILITRHYDLENLFKRLGKSTIPGKDYGTVIAKKYGQTTTQTDKLEKLLQSNRFSCPLVIIAITEDVFRY